MANFNDKRHNYLKAHKFDEEFSKITRNQPQLKSSSDAIKHRENMKGIREMP